MNFEGWTLAQYQTHMCKSAPFALDHIILNFITDAVRPAYEHNGCAIAEDCLDESIPSAAMDIIHEHDHLFAKLRILIESGKCPDDDVRAFLKIGPVEKGLMYWARLRSVVKDRDGTLLGATWMKIIEKYLM